MNISARRDKSDLVRGIRFGIGFALSAMATGIFVAHAAAIWGSLPSAGTNTTLSSTAWNDIVSQVNQLATAIQVSGTSVGIGQAPTSSNLTVNGDIKATNAAKAWVAFDGTTLSVLDSYGVASVTRATSVNSAGAYKITWSTPFSTNKYVVLGTCNAWGYNGTSFTLEGNAVSGHTYQGLFANYATVGCRVASTNANADSNVVMVVAYGK